MAVERLGIGRDSVDSFLTGLFVAAMVVGLLGVGIELGAASEGASVDVAAVAVMGCGAIASASGLYWIRAGD